ncbi:unnamed protein product [Darwinula stevensoni]|uniref:C2H2-type domain-containing protein n=1 Tax=Darwinula stevensoni TaxID=69355 RepID=A0A7R8X1A5_9CRUS|nr:unnamed protein product [Darwinula stevensoni]CAG0882596.1 unnamed protein product [Darwinula stevensoni]
MDTIPKDESVPSCRCSMKIEVVYPLTALNAAESIEASDPQPEGSSKAEKPDGERKGRRGRKGAGMKGQESRICEYCGAVFSPERIRCFYKHMREHRRAKEQDLRCTECGKEFPNRRSLKYHFTVHSDERPFKCPICEKTFKKKFVLKRHTRTHTNYRPFVCGVCGKMFQVPWNLKVHMRIHSGERPFHCERCGRSFAYNSILKVHKCKPGPGTHPRGGNGVDCDGMCQRGGGAASDISILQANGMLIQAILSRGSV